MTTSCLNVNLTPHLVTIAWRSLAQLPQQQFGSCRNAYKPEWPSFWPATMSGHASRIPPFPSTPCNWRVCSLMEIMPICGRFLKRDS